MNVLWSYFWPVFAAGLACGLIAGLVGFRLKIIRSPGSEPTLVRPPARRRTLAILGGIAV